ncbi:hypothetical protein ACETKC_14555 [Brevundimonas intermedia]|uniref:hypothetical protein n=1 Tax=Brevundimonas intermedia TaxID=74315 RepID=UPI0035A223E2
MVRSSTTRPGSKSPSAETFWTLPHQNDVFRYYRSDSASALASGADIRTALVRFGIDASHGYERIHESALADLTRLLIAYADSDVEIGRGADRLSPPRLS